MSATRQQTPKKRVVMRGLCEQCKKSPRVWTWKGWCVTRPEGILIQSAERGHPDCVKICLKAGASVNKHFQKVYSNDTALMKASEKGHLQCVKLLIKEGADVNAWNELGYTSLSYAASNDHAGVVNTLIRAGADVNDRDCNGRTCLIHAVECGHDACVNLLVRAGADVNKEWRGETALMIAVMLGHQRCTDLLLKAGADVNSADYHANTPLHKALDISEKHSKPCSTILKVIRAVLRAGAHVNMMNRRHLTPLEYYFQERKDRLGAFLGFACLSWDTPEPCNGDCERKAVRILLAAGERASDNISQGVQGVRPAGNLTLMGHSTEAIRNHLLKLDPHIHLFGRVPKLGLPSLLTEYLLYGTSLEDDNHDGDTVAVRRYLLRRRVSRR